MSKWKLITDSGADIPLDLANELGIEILQFPVIVGDKECIAGVDFSNDEFYNILMNESKIPTHSQITSIQFVDKYKQYAEEGVEHIIYVSINSKGSATHNNAIMAKDMFFEENPEYAGKVEITVIDSKAYSIAYGYPVIESAKRLNAGASCKEVINYLNDWFNSVEIFFAPYSLEFVKKSGRVSCAAAFVGELLGFKPIITFVDGEVKIIEKVRGEKAIIPALIKNAKNRMIPQTPFIRIKGCLEEEGKNLEKEAIKAFGNNSQGLYSAGPVIAINAGPKVVGIVVKCSPKH